MASRSHGPVLLLIDNQVSFGRAFEVFLREAEPTWEVRLHASPPNGHPVAFDENYDALVVGMEDDEGELLDICRRARARSPAPIVVVSAQNGPDERAKALAAGADDFVERSAGYSHLRSRLHLALSRAVNQRQAEVSGLFERGPFKVDLRAQQLTIDDRALDLSRHQWLLLVQLLQQPHVAVEPAALCRIAGIQDDASHQNLRAEMSRLRQRLKGSGVSVESVRSVGYRLRVPDL
jgi:DNA-binding response OmpR family regulator